MSLADSLLASILGALVVWLTTNIATHFVKKSRLRAALLTDISLNVAGAKEQRAAVVKLLSGHAIEGQKLPFPIYYNVGEYLLYKSIQRDLPEYLRKSELVKVVKFYQALWELDVSINALASILGQWERNSVVLSKEQVAHANKRKDRIESICEVLSSKEIRCLPDLPDDYRSVKCPESVVGTA